MSITQLPACTCLKVSSGVQARPRRGCVIRKPVFRFLFLLFLTCLSACDDSAWNDPYPHKDARANILYSSFGERPKHMDPARSYSSNEYVFIGQIYEPPLQYHYLKRPYELIPLAADSMPEVSYKDKNGFPVGESSQAGVIAESRYDITLKAGMLYQPHPAFAKDEKGHYLYHQMSDKQLQPIHTLADFKQFSSREVTAQDYVNQIKRLADPRNHSPISSLMAQYVLGFEEAAQAIRKKIAENKKSAQGEYQYIDLSQIEMKGVEVLDEHHYRIRLKGRYPQFVYWLSMTFFSPMPWEAEKFYSQPGLKERNISLDWYPLGSGPYMLTENNPNLRMVLQRNPNFHGEDCPVRAMPQQIAEGLLKDAGKAMPFIDRAVYNLEKETIPYWNKFLQGYYDSSGISSDSFDQAVSLNAGGEASLTEEMQHKGMRLKSSVQASIHYMGFNMRDPIVGGNTEKARLLRQAISIAMDYEEFISIFANGRGVAAQGMLPPGIFGFREGTKGINPYVYDVNKFVRASRKPISYARELMKKAGYVDGIDMQTGKPLILYFDAKSSGPSDRARLNWVVKQFEKLGIDLVLRSTDYNRFQEKMRKGSAQIFMWGWNADYPDPENFFFLLFGGNCKQDNNGENAANYQNAEFDALFERMKYMPNGEERQKIVDQMQEILRHDAPWVWGYHPKGYSLYHNWFKNVEPNLMANNTLKYKRLDSDVRAEKRAQWNKPVLLPLLLLSVLLLLALIPAIVMYRQSERSQAL
ncbi:MAG: ABC transporter substrate-binding protein [gamma proteobacterium symbiont of Bathyaustriella thionipta]|nr:ABC transporter substrate-binding protein [gamma proteobacterium symbiont of Bathyaustriella thionipta]